MRLKLSLLALAALALGACSNQVQSIRPLFTAVDSVGLAQFKPGVWWQGPMADCPYDESLPAEKWPDCAGALLFGDHGLEAEIEKGEVKPLAEAEPVDFVVAEGAPMVIQYISRPRGPDDAYSFMAVGPTQLDGAGQVTAFRIWPVGCGPPPPDSETASPRVTTKPWPGLEIKGANCLARDAAAVRFAARKSGALGPASPTIRWLRAGRH